MKLNEIELSVNIEISHEECEAEFEVLDIFKILTAKEAYIMKLLYVYCLSVSEVADYMKISHQAVNQIKNRSMKKIRELYLYKY